MNSTRKLQEAKGNFSQLVKRAAGGDAQTVTVHGKPTAVIVSAEEFARAHPPETWQTLCCPAVPRSGNR